MGLAICRDTKVEIPCWWLNIQYFSFHSVCLNRINCLQLVNLIRTLDSSEVDLHNILDSLCDGFVTSKITHIYNLNEPRQDNVSSPR